MEQLTCHCGNARRIGGRYCLRCHAAWARKYRRKYRDFTPEQKDKADARSYTNLLVRRGKLAKKRCEVCGKKAEKHHPDYKDPRRVRWLCTQHHHQLHRILNKHPK